MSRGNALRVDPGFGATPGPALDGGLAGGASLESTAAAGEPAIVDDQPDITDVAAEFVWVMAPTHAAPKRFGANSRTFIVSVFVHIAAIAVILRFVQAPAPIAAAQETSVEIVQEAPRPPAAAVAGPAKQDPPPGKPEEAEAMPVTPPDKPLDTAKQEPAKQELAKPQTEAKPQPDPRAMEDAKALQALQDELETLKAQKDGLQKQADAVEEQAKVEAEEDRLAAQAKTAADTAKALGPLPASFQAIALPALGATGEDAVSYQQQVFSQLAKAKKAGRHVVSPGIAHVVFHIDAAGKLLDVTLDHPSGDAFLDDEAVAIVRRAAPFPPPPPGEQRAFSASMKFIAEE